MKGKKIYGMRTRCRKLRIGIKEGKAILKFLLQRKLTSVKQSL